MAELTWGLPQYSMWPPPSTAAFSECATRTEMCPPPSTAATALGRIDGAQVDHAAAFDRGADLMLVRKVAHAFDVAAALDRRAAEFGRHDLDAQVVVVRAIVLAGLDDELVAAFDVELGVLRAAGKQRHALSVAMLDGYMAAALEFDGFECRHVDGGLGLGKARQCEHGGGGEKQAGHGAQLLGGTTLNLGAVH